MEHKANHEDLVFLTARIHRLVLKGKLLGEILEGKDGRFTVFIGCNIDLYVCDIEMHPCFYESFEEAWDILVAFLPSDIRKQCRDTMPVIQDNNERLRMLKLAMQCEAAGAHLYGES